MPPRHHEQQTPVQRADALLTLSAGRYPHAPNLNAPEHLIAVAAGVDGAQFLGGHPRGYDLAAHALNVVDVIFVSSLP